MFFARLNQFRRTLLFRLMLWNIFVILLTASATLFGMQFGVRRALLHEVDTFLLDDVDSLQGFQLDLATLSNRPTGARRSSLQHHGHGRFVTVLDMQGRVLWASDDQPGELPPQLPLDDLGPAHVADYRLVQRTISSSDGTPLVARVGIPLSVIAEDVNRVDMLAVIVACIILLIAPLVGYALARRVILVLRDITRRTSRLRPARLDERLPIRGTGDELDQLAVTVNGLLDRLASYLSRRDDFVANAAHELRTPLAAIRSTAEVALGVHRTPGEYEGILEDVIDECSSLDHLVNQLLLLSESEADRIRIHGERVALDEVVAHSVDMFAAVAESQEIEFQTRLAPAVVEGNRHSLRQVINNLLDNALKFTPAGGRIEVTLEQQSSPQETVLQVANTGPGIPPHELGLVFERFYQCDKSRSSQNGRRGTGLGLSICKNIVEAHNGRIQVESRPNELTVFTVTLPTAT